MQRRNIKPTHVLAIPPSSQIILECANDSMALSVARDIANEIGRSVTVRSDDSRVIGTIPAPLRQ